MFSRLSRRLRLALLLALSVGVVAWKGHTKVAFAQSEDEDDDGGDDGDDGGDEDDGGGGEDDGGGDDDDGAIDKDQPPITAGGLYTMATYPVRENSRPLTITEKIGQIRLGLGTDLSAKGAFKTFGVNLEAIYGVHDNFQVIGGFTNAYNMKQFGAYFGFEGALLYDIVDIRLAANIHRNALAQYDVFCNPPAVPNEMPDVATGTCQNDDATQDFLPNGNFKSGGTKFSIDLGFPFRYAVRPEIAIVALQTLMSIDFNSVDRDFTTITANPEFDKDDPQPGVTSTLQQVKGNGAKPDLNPSIGIATNPIPALSVTIFAQLRVPDFDTSAGAFQIPVTGRFEFSPNQKLDVGLEFTLLNVKPPEGQSPIDNRYLSLFVQSRFGR